MSKTTALALVCALWGTASADPEGYQGGEGRPAGTTLKLGEGVPSMTVRRVTVETTIVDGKWICGGLPAAKGTYDLVTVMVELSNPFATPAATELNSFDLVIGKNKTVIDGTCTLGERVDSNEPIPPKKSRTVREQFLIPRGEMPKILVYNNDDFPPLFALPKAKRVVAKTKRSSASH